MMTWRQFSTLHLINSSRMANQIKATSEMIEAANLLLSMSRDSAPEPRDDDTRRSTRRKFTNSKYSQFDM